MPCLGQWRNAGLPLGENHRVFPLRLGRGVILLFSPTFMFADDARPCKENVLESGFHSHVFGAAQIWHHELREFLERGLPILSFLQRNVLLAKLLLPRRAQGCPKRTIFARFEFRESSILLVEVSDQFSVFGIGMVLKAFHQVEACAVLAKFQSGSKQVVALQYAAIRSHLAEVHQQPSKTFDKL